MEFERYQNERLVLNPGNALESSNGKKEKEGKNCRWSERQTRSLIKEWKDNVTELESSRNRQAWLKIISNVNKNGPDKTVDQAKKKLSNLKDAYKKAKENNRKSGAAPEFPPFFEDFDEILSCRPIVELDLVKEVGVAVVRDTSCEDRVVVERGAEDVELVEELNQEGNRTDDRRGDHYADEVCDENESNDDADNNGNKKRKKRMSCTGKNGEKAKKVKENFKDKFLEMQERQMEALKESDQRNREFLVQLEEQQRKAAIEEKERDREFFMQLATLLAKK